MKYILGIDTSCYTTSMALVDLHGNLVFSSQVPLEVKVGERGLQQSKALFQHLHRLPSFTEKVANFIQPKEDIAAICSSSRPRPLSDSYMPVFMVSHLVGQAFANMLGIPYYSVSHQENHIQAGQFSAQGPKCSNFLTIHLSGGTTELLEVTDRGAAFEINIMGATQDLHAGQFVDRVGVAMGLPFPAGPYLEEYALEGHEGKVRIPSYVKGLTVGFSGAETHALRLIKQGICKKDVAAAVYHCLVKTMEKWICNVTRGKKTKNILMVGGVTSSTIFRGKLTKRLKKMDNDICLYFAEPQLSKDNAVGTALLGLKLYKSDNNRNNM